MYKQTKNRTESGTTQVLLLLLWTRFQRQINKTKQTDKKNPKQNQKNFSVRSLTKQIMSKCVCVCVFYYYFMIYAGRICGGLLDRERKINKIKSQIDNNWVR